MDGISIGVAVFAQFTCVPNTQTDVRPLAARSGSAATARIYSAACRPAMRAKKPTFLAYVEYLIFYRLFDSPDASA